MDNFGLVSIITPTYNCGRFIAETIESVQGQSYSNWEMLIIDDYSTDNTREIVEQYLEKDNRIMYYCLDKNSGAAVARNTALRIANGRWIAFLDSDDLWKPKKLEHQIKFMLKNGYYFSSTERDVIDEDSKVLNKYVTGPQKISKFGMYSYCWIGCLTVMYDAEKIGIVQIKDIKKNNDYAIWLKVIEKANCYLLKECLASYRIRRGSISRQSKISLIKWNYKLFHEVNEFSLISSIFWTSVNIVCAIYKKRFFIKKR